ncbi:response regulator transcription factor [uncultured Tenacibaculum sp.]|uniref:response regulator transcription factor n=1 Tax=uncultured Tenacibaculum sp. TaxID=174713 RepID=UPI002631666A|nr:response regulator transcription factor [uncultured Tenacibaculum sp.]
MRVHIADDHDLILQGFEVLLKAHGINVVGTSINGTKLLNWFKSNECDVLILDISMPEINGIEVLKILKESNIFVKTIIVSAYDNDSFIYESIKHGARGYVLKDDVSECIIDAINDVNNNKTYYSKRIREIIIENKLDTDFEYVYHEILSNREREVYDSMLKELSLSEIEKKHSLSESTIRTLLQRVRQKFKVKSNVSLVLIALKYLKS